MIILHNSLIGYNWWGRYNRPWTVSVKSLQNECAFLTFGPRQGTNSFFTGYILDFNISVTTATFSVFTPTTQGFFWQFLSTLKRSRIHLKRRGDLPFRLHWSQLAKRAALRGHSDPLDLPLCRPWALHGVTHAPGAQGQTGSSAHNHNGRSHPIPIAFPFTGGRRERSCGAYYCGWGKFSWNGRGDGKGSPLTLIWENNTAPAPTEKQFSRWQSRPACLWQKTVN